MILHTVGTDTRIGYDWRDDHGDPITVGSAVWQVFDRADDPVPGTATPVLNVDDVAVSIHIDSTVDLPTGNYSYNLTAVDAVTGDTTTLAGGLLRIETVPA